MLGRMAAIDDLKTAWTARLLTIVDDVVRAEATYALDAYVAALAKQSALEANTIQSYTLGGRTVTRRTSADGRALIQSLKTELYRYCYGSVTLADLNTEVDVP